MPIVTNSLVNTISEREWDKLINLVLERCVVPVVGVELLTIERDGHEELLYDLWGQALLESYPDSPVSPVDLRAPLLYQVTNKLSQNQNMGELAYDIDDVIRRKPWPIPVGLRKLAAITSFPLFITASIDHLMVAAIEEEQSSTVGKVKQIVFTPRGTKSSVDLPDDFHSSPEPTVFHLFGATGPVEGTFAKTEDDLIVYSWSLLDQQYAPQRLYDYLQQKTILLLGCNFPDWLGRFLVHALYSGRQEASINIYQVSNHSEPGMEDYLRRKRAKIFPAQSPTSFLTELHRRWLAKKPAGIISCGESQCSPSSHNIPFRRGSVFLSYAREDRAAVRLLKAQLEAANIDTWMDEEDLEPGDNFRQVIHDNIKNASFFIAIISRSLNDLDQQERRLGRFVWREWKWAVDANMDRRDGDRFLQPLVIDNTPAGATFVEPPIRDFSHWTSLQNGRLPDEFIQFLSRGIRSFRRGK
jgi:hypothetical protein